jgi:lactoylglutathione lyase
MRLAKPHLDVGIFTNRLEEQLAFWQGEVGLELEGVLPLGGGNQQHRHVMNGSVLKLNASSNPVLSGIPTGYGILYIARPGLARPKDLIDPDNSIVVLVPPGYEGVTGIGVSILVRDVQVSERHYVRALGWELAGRARGWDGTGESRIRVGDTMLVLEKHPSDNPLPTTELRGTGYRYLTVQVWDVDEEHAAALARGATEGQPPRTLGSTARISFLRDPDGNWLEVSQRASLTGPLPP